jgi:hypothetical protein
MFKRPLGDGLARVVVQLSRRRRGVEGTVGGSSCLSTRPTC